MDTIASLDYEVNSRLASQQQLVNQLASSTARATTELNAAREKTKKEGNDVKGMESGWSLKAFKAAIKGNKAEKMDKEVQQWVAAQEVEKGKEVALATVSAELARETNELNQLKAKQAHSTQLKAQLDQLLERVFSGPTPEFPDEDRLENDVATALRYLNDAARDLPYYQNVLNLLVSAEQEAQQALQALSQASTANTVDMFSDSVGVDIMKQSLLQRGREHADRSNSFLEQARQLMPGLPGIGNVRISGTDMMLDIVFDNVFTGGLFLEGIDSLVPLTDLL